MRIDLFLTESGLCASRSKAAAAIKEGRVLIAGKPVSKASFDVSGTEAIEVVPEENEFVSRAGKKLHAALEAFGIDVKGKTVADLGASTGGFTDCVLQRGASFVYAVDVGSGQLDEKLRTDKRVRNLENTNARYLDADTLGGTVDLVVTDVSFISQRLLYRSVAEILKDGGEFISLIKPQFEVGPKYVGKNGIVHDPGGKLFEKVLSELREAGTENGLALCATADSPILGGDGNKEYLAYWIKQKKEGAEE